MKIQVDLNEQLWNDFKSKVQGDGKTLKEVVPTVFEPALRHYLEWENLCEKCGKPITSVEWISGGGFTDGITKVCGDCMDKSTNPTQPHKGKFIAEIEKERAPTSNEFPESVPFKAPPPEETKSIIKEIEDRVEVIKEDINKRIAVPPPLPTVKRCELCDMPTERRFNLKGRKVCYSCWRDGIINEAVPAPPVSNTSQPEGPSPSSVSSPS